MYIQPIEGEPQEPQADRIIIYCYEKILVHKDYQIFLLEEQIKLLLSRNERQETYLIGYENLYGGYQTKYRN